MTRYLLESPFVPLIAWTIGIALVTQAAKRAARAAGIRHHRIVERTLPLWPVAIGAATGLSFPHELGIGAIVNGGHHATHALGVFYGAGLGLASSGVFRAVLEMAPDAVRERLTLPDQGA